MSQPFDPFDSGEWVDRPNCEAFEIAIDIRTRGALAITAVPVLEAHLGACESCRAYVEVVGKVDAAFSVKATTLPSSAEWENVQKKMREGVRRYRRRPWVLASVFLGSIALAWILDVVFGQPRPSLKALGGAFAVYLAMVVALYFRELRRVRRVLAQTDVVATYRDELERGVRGLRSTNKMLPWLLGIELLQAMGQATRANGSGVPILVLTGFFFVGTVAALIIQRRTVRRLESELAELH